MKRNTCSVIFTMISLIFISCATTDDPREGGLFSYNPNAYEKRLDQRQQRLDDIKLQQKEAEEISQKLSIEKDAVLKEKQRYHKQNAELKRRVALLELTMERTSTETQEKQNKANEINKRLSEIKKKIKDEKDNISPDIKNKENELNQLNLKIDQLLQEAEALSQL